MDASFGRGGLVAAGWVGRAPGVDAEDVVAVGAAASAVRGAARAAESTGGGGVGIGGAQPAIAAAIRAAREMRCVKATIVPNPDIID